MQHTRLKLRARAPNRAAVGRREQGLARLARAAVSAERGTAEARGAALPLNAESGALRLPTWQKSSLLLRMRSSSTPTSSITHVALLIDGYAPWNDSMRSASPYTGMSITLTAGTEGCTRSE